MNTASMLADSLHKVKKNIQKRRPEPHAGGRLQWESDVQGAEVLFEKQDEVHGETISKYWARRRAVEALMESNEELHFLLDRLLDGKERWERSREDYYGRSADEPETSKTRSRTFYDPDSGESFRFTKTWPPPSPPSPPPRSPTPPPRPKTPPHRPSTPEGKTRGPKPFVRPGTLPPSSHIDYWFCEVELALKDPTTVTTFPEPPHFLCAPAAEKCPRAALGLCVCCIEDLFRSSSERMEELKTLRLKFHPDKFARCPEDVREQVQAEAAEVFKIVDRLWREQEERRKQEWNRENERRYAPRKR